MLTFKYGNGHLPYGSVTLAIGVFDGVHIAHRELIRTAVTEAAALGIPAGVFTFTGNIKSNAPRIYTDNEKLEIIESLGVDFVIYADFKDIADISAEDFCKKILIEELHTKVAVVGYNFRFGKGALGNPELLDTLMRSAGERAVIIPKLCVNGLPVSSSRIRELLEGGKCSEAERLLGAPYFVSGTVEHGIGKGGDTLGVPTVNIPQKPSGVMLPLGVYRAALECDGKVYSAVCNVGKCPTLSPREIHLEAHIIDFSGTLYNKSVRIYLLDFLREELVFKSADELKMQINIDIKRVVSENGDVEWITTGRS